MLTTVLAKPVPTFTGTSGPVVKQSTPLGSYTPSHVVQTPFQEMMEKRRGILDIIADFAGRAEGVANALASPGGVPVATPAARTDFNFGINSIFRNPLFIAGAVVLAVYAFNK